MLRETILVFAVLIAVAAATQVFECGSGTPYTDSNQIKISGCEKPPCKLKRGTRHTVEQKFVPNRDTEAVSNSVHAAVLSVPLPFVGVDGTSACGNIYNVDNTPAGCSLKKGVEYLYKNEFPILPIYPTISLVIHYALKDASGDLACFEVPAKIIN